jgi:GNAT superfamily N-acetyltransferase
MNWTLTDDPEPYAEQVLPLLSRRPDSNTVALTVLDGLLSGSRWGEGDIVLGWYAVDGEVTGAVSMTPPYGILLAELPESSEYELVELLRSRGVQVPDANGTVADVERFTECWTAGTSLGTKVIMRQLLYSLRDFTPPAPLPAGSARLAEPADLAQLMDWMTAFQQEAEGRAVPPVAANYRRRIEGGLVWFWCDESGRPVACAARNATIAGMSRVGPVFTPKADRRHGYGEAVTAACTQDALDQGAELMVLFTDLQNPTSNAIYQRLGYRPIDERVIQRFV